MMEEIKRIRDEFIDRLEKYEGIKVGIVWAEEEYAFFNVSYFAPEKGYHLTICDVNIDEDLYIEVDCYYHQFMKYVANGDPFELNRLTSIVLNFAEDGWEEAIDYIDECMMQIFSIHQVTKGLYA